MTQTLSASLSARNSSFSYSVRTFTRSCLLEARSVKQILSTRLSICRCRLALLQACLAQARDR